MAKKLQKRNRKRAGTKAKGGKRAADAAPQDRAVREHVIALLRGGNAHLTLDNALEGLPGDLRGVKPAGLPYSVWQLLEHLRLAQWDILEFSRNPHHVSGKFPDDYWPQAEAPADEAAWDASVKAIHADLKAMERLVTARSTDLAARIPHGDGQTVLREALLLADHNAYHIGQILLVRRLLGAWKD